MWKNSTITKKDQDDNVDNTGIWDDPSSFMTDNENQDAGNSVETEEELFKKKCLEKASKKSSFDKDLRYILKLFPSSTVTGIIVKINVGKDGKLEYNKKVGGNFFDEKTLILVDESSNVLLVFEEEEHKVITNQITNNVHILDKYIFSQETVINKKCVPSKVPDHIMVHLVFKDDNKVDNSETKEEAFKKRCLERASKKEINFFDKYYKKEEKGICSWLEMKKHPEWKDEYKNNLEIKLVNMCKSCGKKARKGCCEKYGTKNRSKRWMVIGWSKC